MPVVGLRGLVWGVPGENAHWVNRLRLGIGLGFRAFIHRGLTDKTTVIMLTNGGQTDRVKINEAIINILSGSPHRLP